MASTNNPRKRKEQLTEASPSVGAPLKSSSPSSSKQTTSSRPKVKEHKKVQPSQSGALGASASGSLSASQSGSIGLRDGESVSSAAVSGSIASGSLSEDFDDAVLEESLSEGALAAQEFLQEKHDERELAKERERKRKRRRRILRITIGTLVLLLIAGIVAIVVMFSTFRWNTYDDHADMQGIWQVSGTDAQITISEDTIKLTDDVAYKYVIDPDSKTIRFTFGNLEGQGHYRFSLDRKMLSIMDGQFDWGQTLSEDARWTLDALIEQTTNKSQKTPSGDENITELVKVEEAPL